ncbi:glycosyltransferase [Aestuariirhabdus sp. LZHN29]|uniref:glycosyltransferase n=1 Tax=Aestuariirhabdus sp. LZHN29 TaxID=3417462 RepID=UPI003CF834C5
MQLEVIICTHNRSALLAQTLSSISAAKKPLHADLSVTVIANHCSDDTEERVKELAASYPFPLRVLIEEKAGKSHALNLAIKHLTGDYQIYIDDDHRIDNGFFRNIERVIEQNPDYEIFCGKIIPDWDGHEPLWIHDKQYPVYPLPIPHYDLGEENREITAKERLPGGGNLVMAKAVTAQVGDFNVYLGPLGHNLGGGEDGDYVRRALNKGYRILYDPAPLQYHWVDSKRLTLGYLLKKAYSRSRSAAYIKITNRQLPPRFLFTKMALNICQLLWPIPLARLRFYLMRCSSTAGEIAAYISLYQRRGDKSPPYE